MKILRYILFIALFTSCSNDSLKPEPIRCVKYCVLNSVRVTSTGQHLVYDSKSVTLDCSLPTSIFNIVKDNKGNIVSYQNYRCN